MDTCTGVYIPVIPLHFMGTAQCLGSFLGHMLQGSPALVQILDLDLDLLSSLGLTHGCQLLCNCAQFHQTGLIGLQVLLQGTIQLLSYVHLYHFVSFIMHLYINLPHFITYLYNFTF